MYKHTVFISYSRKDIDVANQLAQDLEKASVEAWWDISDLKGGAAWVRTIQAALKASKHCVVVLSPDAVESEWVEKEYTYAIGLGLKIIPILYKKCEVPMALANIQYIDFRGEKYERGLQELLIALEEDSRRPPKSVTTGLKKQELVGRPVNWEKVGAIAGVIGVLIALGTWLVPNTADFFAQPSETPTVAPTISPTHTPIISTATPTNTPFPPSATPTFASVPPTPTSLPPTDTLTPTDTPTVTPTSSPTHTPVIPTATSTKRATATPITTQTPTNACSFKPSDTFYRAWQGERSPLGCALNEVKVFTAEQPFENGFMFWREDRDRFIYVLYNKGTWQSYEGAFREADPEPAGYSPPPGLQEPILGFGQVWREELGGPNSEIGWAMYHELGFADDRWVDCEHGMMLWSSQWGDLWGIFVLYDDGTWQFK